MEARAKTTEQKKAILAFEKEINAAVSARRSAVDDAISRFRKGIKSAIDARKSAITEAISDFKEAIDDAVEKAENDCQNGTALASVRQVLRTSFQNARVKLQTDKQSIEKLGPNVQTLVATRQKAVQKAVEDFRAAVEKARNNLKNALGKDIDLDGLSETGE
jgi:gas vesicle protein